MHWLDWATESMDGIMLHMLVLVPYDDTPHIRFRSIFEHQDVNSVFTIALTTMAQLSGWIDLSQESLYCMTIGLYSWLQDLMQRRHSLCRGHSFQSDFLEVCSNPTLKSLQDATLGSNVSYGMTSS